MNQVSKTLSILLLMGVLITITIQKPFKIDKSIKYMYPTIDIESSNENILNKEMHIGLGTRSFDQSDKISSIFHIIDKNGDGKISYHELYQFFDDQKRK
ncbi:unnamed protein product [Brachionus calyciflorus]|uniref:EF-hand domain-containing protein n=1 Tax=Brachionus calyciflorus TaxID=104777 RepID=A0A814H918_9BILA|nr:unnamed protein product [Brachionus calyciflorus]